MPAVTSGSFRKGKDAMVGLILTRVSVKFRDLADPYRVVTARDKHSVATLLGRKGLRYSPCFRRCANTVTQCQPICFVSSRNFASERRLAKEGSRVSSMRSGLCSQ
jgi:hypothetical protein